MYGTTVLCGLWTCVERALKGQTDREREAGRKEKEIRVAKKWFITRDIRYIYMTGPKERISAYWKKVH